VDDDYDDCDDDADDDIVNSVLVDNLKKEISELRGVISQLQSSNSQLQAKVDFFVVIRWYYRITNCFC